MTDWLLNLPVAVMAIVILVAIYLATWVIYTVVNRLAVGPRAHAFKSISAGMLSPLAVIFALLVGFFGAQVWNDADRANQAVNREASALRAVVLLGTALPPEVDAQVRNLVRLYIEDAVGGEWPAMAGRGATLKLAPPHLVQVLQLAFAIDPKGPAQVKAQSEMVSAVELARCAAAADHPEPVVAQLGQVAGADPAGGAHDGGDRDGSQRESHRHADHHGIVRHQRGDRGAPAGRALPAVQW